MGWSLWLGIGMGIAVIGGHAVLRLGGHRLARTASDPQRFLVFELGGLGVRMALVLGAIGLVLLYLPVHKVGFAVTVTMLLLVSVGMEVRHIRRRMRQGRLGP